MNYITGIIIVLTSHFGFYLIDKLAPK